MYPYDLMDVPRPKAKTLEHRRCFVCGRFGTGPTWGGEFTCTRPECAGVKWSQSALARLFNPTKEKSRTFTTISGKMIDEPYWDHSDGLKYVA